jgi:hypothetical protein
VPQLLKAPSELGGSLAREFLVDGGVGQILGFAVFSLLVRLRGEPDETSRVNVGAKRGGGSHEDVTSQVNLSLSY